jgi:DNA polymerase-3 subunit gamma/tau
MAWYRIYRPKKIEDLNISSVRESLQRMMENGKIPQSLLFAGPKGTGKTSASRILGAMLNDPANAALVDYVFFKKIAPKKLTFVEPDDSSDFARRVYEGHSFVVQELDAASNRRIDDIRLLKERINLPPSDGKMMVYILDEVHMLTNEAFNALLKILEEPPAHVVFILATTELHKLPATIVSRCSVINFRRATNDELKQALERVLLAEKIKFDESDLKKIVLRADGSFRDGVKVLEMACKNGKLDLEIIKDLLASDNETYIKSLLETVIQKDEHALIKIFEELRNNNYNQRDFYKDLFEFLHKDLLINLAVLEGKASYSIKIDQFFLKEILSIDLNQETPIPFLVLELKFLEIIERSKKTPPTQSASPSKTSQEKPSDKLQNEQELSDSKKKIQKNNLDTELNTKDLWQNLIKNFGTDNFSLLTLLKSCKLESLSEGIAKVFVYYSFHKEQLEQIKNRELLGKAARDLLGIDLRFDFVLQSGSVLATAASEVEDSELMREAKNSLL